MYVCKAMQSRSFLSQISYAGDESGFFIFMAYIPIFVCITMDFFTMHQYYKHFKGNIYKVLYIAKHSETLEDYVVYQAMYGEHGIWVRPKAMFEETITRDGQTFRRFSPISEEEVLRCMK